MPTDQPTTDGPVSPPGEETPGDEIPAAVPGESRIRETNGVRLHAVEAGPVDGELLVLLHGFPEFWYGWHATIEPLAAAGYRVVVPDQRGYNLSEKPDGITPYRIDELARDVVGLIDAYDRETAVLAGHDWGAAVGWWLALHHPDRLRRFLAINLPHPTVFRRTLQSSWRQRLRSWYILAFQFPWIPERVARVRNWAPIVDGMRRSSRPGAFDAEDFDRYRRAWGRPGAFTGMVNWYRAVGRDRPTPTRTTVDVPTRIVWGAGDRFLQRSMAVESLAYCSNGTLQTVHDATHWILHERPNRVVQAIREHVE
ncbi:alpha/beta hydrolase [Halopenitus sp. POP-27]|uniref:alpha/beta fold hydrolase n=1 Tax=Halopenitus sp. POP-27 TaxID=2994425 RepID=UPI00246976BC|nr:alpha/beta hydrolase [Halopenitus sp. POP-27]